MELFSPRAQHPAPITVGGPGNNGALSPKGGVFRRDAEPEGLE